MDNGPIQDSPKIKKSLMADIRERGVFRIIMFIGFAVVGGWMLAPAAPTITNALIHLFRGPTAEPLPLSPVNFIPFAVLGGVIGAAIAAATFGIFERIAHRWDGMDTGDKVTMFAGIFTGFLASLPVVVLLQALQVNTASISVSLFGLTIGFSAVSLYALKSMDEVLPWSKSRGKAKRSGIKILDTNVIIDGRIADVVRNGFLEGEMYVPGFVLDELQYIADSHDALRRQRGKRGLNVLRQMQADFPVTVRSHDRMAPDAGDGVDARLVRLARALGADLVTNDHNLNQVAKLQEVKVLNLNDLALSLRPNVLPGEGLCLTIIREGNQVGQGIGYLDDGTMVVVENGRSHISETLEVNVTQVIQTERGKMIFAEVDMGDDGTRRRPNSTRQPN